MQRVCCYKCTSEGISSFSEFPTFLSIHVQIGIVVLVNLIISLCSKEIYQLCKRPRCGSRVLLLGQRPCYSSTPCTKMCYSHWHLPSIGQGETGLDSVTLIVYGITQVTPACPGLVSAPDIGRPGIVQPPCVMIHHDCMNLRLRSVYSFAMYHHFILLQFIIVSPVACQPLSRLKHPAQWTCLLKSHTAQLKQAVLRRCFRCLCGWEPSMQKYVLICFEQHVDCCS